MESLSAYARQFLGQMDKPDVDSIEGLSPAISIDQKTTSRNPRSTVGTVTEIYDYLRLLWARIGHPHCYNCGQPIAAQSAEQIVDQVMTLAEDTRFMVLAPMVRGRKGEYGKLLRGAARRGLHAREGRRRAAPPRGGDRARQEVQARHRGGGGPPGDAPRPAQAAGRLGRDRRGAGRGDRRGGAGGRGRGAHLLRALRVPQLRHLDARARAAHVQLQLAARRLPALHGARLADGDRPGAGGARPEPVARRGGDPALVHERVELLRADDPGDRRALRDRHGHALGGAAGGGAGLLPLRHQRRPHLHLIPQPLRAPALLHHELRGHHPQPRAPLQGDRLRLLAGEDRGVHVGAAVPRVQGRAAAAGEPGGEGRRARHPRAHPHVREAGDRVVRGA